MARAFKLATEAGRMAYEARLAGINQSATASSPYRFFTVKPLLMFSTLFERYSWDEVRESILAKTAQDVWAATARQKRTL